MGRLDQIYPVVGDHFDMTTPSEWWGHVSATDDDARIFPYIYPPLWAKLVSLIAPLTSFAAFDKVFLIMHQAMLLLGVYLAARMCGFQGTMRIGIVALTYAGLVLSTPIALALDENQPQILVSFLIILAFERAHFGHLRTAGAVLALAASIKIYPLLFIVIFAGRRQWGAIASFAVVGAALGLSSIALAGWPLHSEYLNLIKILGRSVVVTNASFSIDAYLAGTVFSDLLTKVHPPQVPIEASGWSALAKPPLWLAISSVAQLSALCAIAWIAARRPHDPLVMPLAAIILAMLSPLSWAYTYLTAAVFIGAMAVRVGYAGIALAALMMVLFFRVLPMSNFGKFGYGLTGGWLIGGLLMILLGLALGWAIWRRPVVTEVPPPS